MLKRKPKNSSMTRNIEEVKKLGKEMEEFLTKEEVEEKGKMPVPKQEK